MSKLHTLKDGYWTAKGQNKKAVMVTMTPDERVKLYDYICQMEQLKQQLQLDGVLRDWNDHDEKVLPGVADNVGPIHRGGRNKDITLAQMEKLLLAILKIKAACKRLGLEMPFCDVLEPDNTDESEPMLSREEVKRQMDRNRAADKQQEMLKQNPDLIEDDLTPFRHLWPKYKQKK